MGEGEDEGDAPHVGPQEYSSRLVRVSWWALSPPLSPQGSGADAFIYGHLVISITGGERRPLELSLAIIYTVLILSS